MVQIDVSWYNGISNSYNARQVVIINNNKLGTFVDRYNQFFKLKHMSDTVSKYYEKLEDQEWWANKAKEENKSRFEKIKSFMFNLFKTK